MSALLGGEVPAPLHISSRLMAALTIPGAGTVHVSADRRDGEGRVVYSYVLEDADGRHLVTGEDLRSGVGADVDYRATVGTLLSFLSAAAESSEGSESAEIFSPEVTAWARENATEIEGATLDLEGPEED